MRQLVELDAWKIKQNELGTDQRAYESIFSIGNGSFGQRANFEEKYSDKSLLGNYTGGIYYPDPTKVGWWKNGYPDYFAKVLNSCNWIRLDIEIDGYSLDLSMLKVQSFYRELDMKSGILSRKFSCQLPNKKQIQVNCQRFCSMHNDEIGAISYSITSDKEVNINIGSFLDFDIKNEDSNYDDYFWQNVEPRTNEECDLIIAATKKTNFWVALSQLTTLNIENDNFINSCENIIGDRFVSRSFDCVLEAGQTLTINKYTSVLTSLKYDKEKLIDLVNKNAVQAKKNTYEKLKTDHSKAWQQIWDNADIQIEGDINAQQAIRFNIFQLFQTYNGKYSYLNIGPKGFTGEKYGGATYWDTEAYCIPFYLKTSNSSVAKNLLKYRFNQLQKAVENAEKLGFKDGAALFPMVTMNGEECHNEWEITFEEIHRNGAIAYAIYNYVKHTLDYEYLEKYGLDVLVAIAKFWAQRVNWSEDKSKYVILGVTGPNEYENNVNNNWYTNYIAKWCLEYTLESLQRFPNKIQLKETELYQWKDIIDKIYLPTIQGTSIFLQNDGFLDKEIIPATKLPRNQRPINQHWSWDKILRSVFIKQADVLQGLYFFENHFSENVIKENVEYYEPLTVHESSLSPSVHSILFSKINNHKKAYEMYLRTARLDLDDYNHEVHEGLHITSMAGTWLSVVEGFAGIRANEKGLEFKPIVPEQWQSYCFNIMYRNQKVKFDIKKKRSVLTNYGDQTVNISTGSKAYKLEPHSKLTIVC